MSPRCSSASATAGVRFPCSSHRIAAESYSEPAGDVAMAAARVPLAGESPRIRTPWPACLSSRQRRRRALPAALPRAADKHGAGFRSLLWASPQTQAARFDAIDAIVDLNGKSVLDVGCGRADLLEFLLDRGVRPADYVGIEAVDELADAAEAKRAARSDVRIVRADFVARAAAAVRRRRRGRVQRIAQHR